MRKILTLTLILFFIVLTGCSRYYKKTGVTQSRNYDGLEYRVVIYCDMNILEMYSIPLDSATNQRVNSLNRRVDSLIVVMKNLD
jgi:hypothetical protein